MCAKMGIKEFLIPEEKKFFDELEKEAAIVKQGAHVLVKLTKEYDKLEYYAGKLDNYEHECDCVVHDITKMLNGTFITPIDREDIHALTTEIDDVMDIMDAVGRRLMIFKIKKKVPLYLPENAELILKSVTEMENGIKALRDPTMSKNLEKCCITVNEVENKSDELLARALGELFDTDDVRYIMKMKEIYDLLEICTDKCEVVANHILEISGKNA
jgi:uncharacterized protein Yka (UPF0111/DUF47 family)